MVLVVVGVRPETTLAADAGATLGVKGAIAVDPGMRTGLPDVLAAGDCVITHHRLLGETYLPLGTTAHKQGRVAGENALGGNRQFAGSLGTQVVKIFDQAAARTGLRDHEAAAAGFNPFTVETQADDHKAYYPGSHRITIRVTGDRATGRLLGMQLFGHKNAEIAKRVDIAATAIYHGMTVEAVSDLDLSYTPPLGSPWDAVQMAAQAWARATRRANPLRIFSAEEHPCQRTPHGPALSPATPPHPALWAAAAAIIVLAVGACSSTTSTSGTLASAVAAASLPRRPRGPPSPGPGSTFDAPFFSVAFTRYQQQHPGVTVGYSAVGSSAGIAAFSAGQVDFGASDVPMTASEQAAATGGPITQVPVALGGEGVAYNLSLPAGARLHLTGPVLAAIFLGQITRWNDPAITALNPGLSLPARVRSKSCTAPTAAAPPTSSATTCPAVEPGLGGQGRHRQDPALAGRGRRRRQRRSGHQR